MQVSDGDGDDGADGGDDVDDDPDDARRDGDDDGGDSPLREGNFLAVFSLPGLFVSLSGFHLMEAAAKLFINDPVFLGQGVVVRQRGAGGGSQGQGPPPAAARGGAAAGTRPSSWRLPSGPSSGSVGLL